MTRRQFMKWAGATLAGGWALAMAGCVAPRISPSVDASTAQPWRCGYCGHLTRSDRDLSAARCPRCRRKQVMQRIGEDDLHRYREQKPEEKTRS